MNCKSKRTEKVGLAEWGAYMRGAKMMLFRLNENGCLDLNPHVSKKDGKNVYNKATLDWLMADPANIQTFLSGSGFYFTDFQKNEKGRLISCRVTEKHPGQMINVNKQN